MKLKKYQIHAILRELLEWAICIVIAFILYLFVNYYLGTISGVKQVSMESTALEGDKLLIQRTKVFNRKLNYGDIVTFESPTSSKGSVSTAPTNLDVSENTLRGEDAKATFVELDGFTGFMYDFVGISKTSYIKRVIGVEKDHIMVSSDGFVYRNGERLLESYLKDARTDQNGGYIDVVVPDGCVFVMGDNRLESKDSRYFGCIPLEKIEGIVITRIWPLSRIGALN